MKKRTLLDPNYTINYKKNRYGFWQDVSSSVFEDAGLKMLDYDHKPEVDDDPVVEIIVIDEDVTMEDRGSGPEHAECGPSMTKNELNTNEAPDLEEKKESSQETVTATRKETAVREATGESVLHVAAASGDAKLITTLLDSTSRTTDVNSKSFNGSTPLHSAVISGNKKLVSLLISKKADVNAEDSLGYSPLHLAAFHGHAPVIQKLAKCGANINALNKRHGTAIHCAAFNGRYNVIAPLVAAGATIDAKSAGGDTALHVAAFKGAKRTVLKLVATGADIFVTNDVLESALHTATKANQSSIVELLIVLHSNAAAANADGNTPLHLAAASGKQANIMTILLEADKIVTKMTNNLGMTPLHVATKHNHLENVSTLFKYYDGDLLEVDNDGNTPLHIACLNRNPAMVSLILSKTKNPDLCYALNLSGESALHIAQRTGDETCLNAMLKFNPDVNKWNEEGFSIFHLAVINSQFDMVAILAANGAKFDALSAENKTVVEYALQDDAMLMTLLKLHSDLQNLFFEDEGNSLAHMAARGNCCGTLKFLLQIGYDFNRINWSGNTPLHLADTAEITEILLQKTAAGTLEAKNSAGNTALHIAAANENHQQILLLVENKASVVATDMHGSTPLHAATGRNSAKSVTTLISLGAPIDLPNIHGHTPLHVASYHGHSNMVQQFLCANADITMKNNKGQTALDLAIAAKKTKVVELLTAKRNQLSSKSNLIVAIRQGDCKLVKTVINLNDGNLSKYDHEVSLIQFTVECSLRFQKDAAKYEEILQLLVKANCNIDALDSYHCTPLFNACAQANVKLAMCLMELGANTFIPSNKGLSPLQHVQQQIKKERDLRGVMNLQKIIDVIAPRNANDAQYQIDPILLPKVTVTTNENNNSSSSNNNNNMKKNRNTHNHQQFNNNNNY